MSALDNGVPSIRRATAADLPELVSLFDLYRQFYGQGSDRPAARRFLEDRLSVDETTLLVAPGGRRLLGFAHLFPSFSSIQMARTIILNDLFVAPVARGRGVGGALLDAAVAYARNAGALRMSLSTARDNSSAQRLYRSRGWRHDEDFIVYELELGSD